MVLYNPGCTRLTTRQQELELTVPLNIPFSSQLPKEPKNLRKQEPTQKPGTHKRRKSYNRLGLKSHFPLSSRKVSPIRSIMLSLG